MKGAMVLSLDFELIWGVRDIYRVTDPYVLRVIHERMVIPHILELFEEYDIAATWATVGSMFAQTRAELVQFTPPIKPQYQDDNLNPYQETVGMGEWDDPLHYGYQLIKRISQTKRQEIATHTFSHYYCLEAGQTREAFTSDLASALALAQKKGISIRSIVFPRNQHNPAYDDLLLDCGIICYRGTENHPVYRPFGRRNSRLPYKRLYRLVDSHLTLSGSHLTDWGDVIKTSGLCDVAASRYLRPTKNSGTWLAKLRLNRIVKVMEEAARTKKIFHLWFHPQDFGLNPEDNLRFLKIILEHFRKLQAEYGMVSLSMLEVAHRAKEYQFGQKRE